MYQILSVAQRRARARKNWNLVRNRLATYRVGGSGVSRRTGIFGTWLRRGERAQWARKSLGYLRGAVARKRMMKKWAVRYAPIFGKYRKRW